MQLKNVVYKKKFIKLRMFFSVAIIILLYSKSYVMIYSLIFCHDDEGM